MITGWTLNDSCISAGFLKNDLIVKDNYSTAIRKAILVLSGLPLLASGIREKLVYVGFSGNLEKPHRKGFGKAFY